MSIYIISNRSVQLKNKKERFNSNGKEKASPTFRVAEYFPDRKDYEIFPDRAASDYSDLAANKKNADLTGTGKLFFELFKQLSSTTQRSDVLVFIHGFNYDLEANLEHIEQLKKKYLDRASCTVDHLVYVSWPSLGRLWKYTDDQPDAIDTGAILGRAFRKVHQFYADMFDSGDHDPCRQRIHLAAHSMGNQVLHHFAAQLGETPYPLFSEILLLNADCDHDLFEPGKAFSHLHKLCERVHIYINQEDDALLVSQGTKNKKQRMGRKGPTNINHLAPNVLIMDTTGAGQRDDVALKERIGDHWGYLERKPVREDIIQVLAGIDEDDIPKRKVWDANPKYFYLP
ncbi:hypothetical protein BTA51_03135 [Hahella sp. CCB-MM4]|uniref:alpha/beta hydrolase n=1 Tax=Hahella sp. (strain CCB-MM4) TaxID=1926491 RepID=UPI000BD1648D|nr:alpha/beta hydrolase [Hahella sp. CCB-MM4]OZG75387.1 hypothetical protein BTA51_03135 [Hahella sp. CCB-MM4]